MGEDGARGKDWLRARASPVSYRHNFLVSLIRGERIFSYSLSLLGELHVDAFRLSVFKIKYKRYLLGREISLYT